MASKVVKYTIKRKNGGVTHSSINLGIGSVTNPTESLIYSKLKDHLRYTLKPGDELIITKIG
jgi:hypothetical protein